MSNTLMEPPKASPSACKTNRAPKIQEVQFGHGAKVDILGEILFARYVVPCQLGEYLCKRLTEQEWQLSLAIALGGIMQTDRAFCRGFFEQRFDVPVNGLYAYGKSRGLLSDDEIWSLSNVSGFWHEHEGHAKECAVREVVIEKSMGNRMVPQAGKSCKLYSARCKAETFPLLVVDVYDLGPKHDSQVFIHKHVITELG